MEHAKNKPQPVAPGLSHLSRVLQEGPTVMAHKNFPISIKNTSMIPDDLVSSPSDRELTKVYKVLNYELMIQSNLTMRHLHEMQCDLQHIMHSWGDPPNAKNLNFSGSTKKTILAIHMALQSGGLRKKFNQLQWFDMGMTMGDLMQMQLAVPVLLTFNLSVSVLLENNANDYGRSWQSLFKWSRKEWNSLGYDAVAYKKQIHLNEAQRPLGRIQILEQWGPDEAYQVPGSGLLDSYRLEAGGSCV